MFLFFLFKQTTTSAYRIQIIAPPPPLGTAHLLVSYISLIIKIYNYNSLLKYNLNKIIFL